MDSPHFICTVRINLLTEEDANVWMIKMSEHNKCTYRTTKTVKPEQKRVKCKFAKHCQHFAKKLTPKQAEKSPVSRAIKVKAPLSSQLRNKNTQCPSSFTLAVQIPSQLQKRKARLHPHLLTHCGVIKIQFNHNHPISAAHTLSFRDVSMDTKEKFTALFNMGHNASSARHVHEQKLLCEAELDKQVAFADRSINANPQFVGSMTNGGLVLMEKMMERSCFKSFKKLLICTIRMERAKQCYNGMMLDKIKVLLMTVVTLMKMN